MAKKMPGWIVNLIITVLAPLVNLLTPMLKEELTDFVVKLYEKAKGTDNPIDDLFVKFLAGLLEIDLPS